MYVSKSGQGRPNVHTKVKKKEALIKSNHSKLLSNFSAFDANFLASYQGLLLSPFPWVLPLLQSHWVLFCPSSCGEILGFLLQGGSRNRAPCFVFSFSLFVSFCSFLCPLHWEHQMWTFGRIRSILGLWKPIQVIVIYILELGFMKMHNLYTIPLPALLRNLDLVVKIMDVPMPII